MRNLFQNGFRSQIVRHLDALAVRLMFPEERPTFDFTQPAGERALVGPDSISWRIFKNPVSLVVGGIAAVILELAEPAVRTGVWEHSSFRTAPMRRLQRTGLAAMITVYGPRSTAEKMIAGVVRRHETVYGTTPTGEPYNANDTPLLDWVQATATYGFARAYSRYVSPLGREEFSLLFSEGREAARLYGAINAPASLSGWERLLESMKTRLEPSPIIFEFLEIMQEAVILPKPFGPLQRIMVRAAVDITPQWVRERLGLGCVHGLRTGEDVFLRSVGGVADEIALPSIPPVQACLRLGLPANYLYGNSPSRVRRGTAPAEPRV